MHLGEKGGKALKEIGEGGLLYFRLLLGGLCTVNEQWKINCTASFLDFSSS